MSDSDWTPSRIIALRNARSQSQTEFGMELLDATPGYAQKRVSQLENRERTPTAAERRTLNRMQKGEI